LDADVVTSAAGWKQLTGVGVHVAEGNVHVVAGPVDIAGEREDAGQLIEDGRERRRRDVRVGAHFDL
jgi:hypothetical protein